MYNDPNQKYAITHWDNSIEIIRAIVYPGDPENVIRILYADGVCHISDLQAFTLEAVPVTLN